MNLVCHPYQLEKASIRNKLAGAVGLLLALGLVLSLSVPALAVEQIPHQFWGDVTVGGEQCPEGIAVTAEVNGVQRSIAVDSEGKYGWEESFFVPADDPDTTEIEGGQPGDTVNFFVAGVPAQTFSPFESGQRTELDLSIAELPVFYELTVDSTAGGKVTEPGEEGPYSYAEGTEVDLLAVADSGYKFVNWTGDVGTIADVEAADTTITMNGDYSITAVFEEEVVPPVEYELTMNVVGQGTVSPGSGTYPEGDMTISANPASGWKFVNWSTADMDEIANPNKATTTLTLDKDKTVTAKFEEEPSPPSGGGGGGDGTPPKISAVGLCPEGVTETTADICWTTNERATSQVEYRNGASTLTPLDETLVTQHHVKLTGLTPGTTYYYKVISKDKAGNKAVSDEYSFTTAGEKPAPPAADISICCLEISPEEVDIGEEVTISFKASNSGDASGSFHAVLSVDGKTEIAYDGILNAGASQVLTHTTSKYTGGTYAVSVDGLSGSFTVLAPGPPPPPPPEKEEEVAPPEEEEEIIAPEVEEEEEEKGANWGMIGGIIAAVVVLGGGGFYWWYRRR